MLEEALLREQFQNLLVKEQEACQAYADLSKQITDPDALQQLQLLQRDKQRHIRLIERLLEIVE